MKSLTALWHKVAIDMATRCCTSTTQDYKTVLSRVEHEGLSFLTITLANFGSDLQKGLDQGFVDSNLFTGFRFKGGLPLFLRGFLCRVFDSGTGLLLDEPCIDSIYAVRQLTLMFNKMLLPTTTSRQVAAIGRYIECEQEVRQADAALSSRDRNDFARVGRLLFADVFSSLDREVFEENLMPAHGPGATADRLLGNKKYDLAEWPERLEKHFPFGEFAIPNWRYRYLLDQVDFLEPGEERPVRVILVPKTLKTPRIIAIEPTAMQYTQQAISRRLVQLLESERIPGFSRDNLCFGMIGFTDQDPNREMAREGSLTGDLATLDLSEASDRVSNQHVRFLLAGHPHLAGAVDACRSRKADVPGFGVMRLAKFASMGSALCFPVEAMVFLTLIFLGIERELNKPVDRKMVKLFSDQVRVYGDDIIVPVDFVPSVVSMLETFGFRVNASKSYWNGKFRESCGKDFYDGVDVTVTRLRREIPTLRRDVSEVVSLVSFRNHAYRAGLWGTCKFLDAKIEKILSYFPAVQDTSSGLGKVSFLGFDVEKQHPTLHKPLVRAWVENSRPPVSIASGEGALLKWFLKTGDLPFADKNHLERFGRPDAVDIKLRWVSPL